MNFGEVITLGDHRLMCGDSTNEYHVSQLMKGTHARLLFTSPPYADIYDYSGNNLAPEHLASFIPNFRDYTDIMCVNLGIKKKNHEIITYWDDYIYAAHSCGLKLLSWNIWDKINPGSIAQQQFMFPLRHEFIFVFGKSPVKLNRTIPKHGIDFMRGKILPERSKNQREHNGEFTRFHTSNHQYNEKNKQLETVITQGAVKSRPVWGTAQMPVELAEEYIKAVTDEGDCVIDCFGGSGTTLIACERLNRKCFTMEINPAMCDVIVKRFKSLSPMFYGEMVSG
ncbi:MAG: site-specific DNA-methyltransferase [Synergistaceae bacterium]|nr:site-specific DNA-methyltransferase [Synergistaceae bacterium]